MTATPSDEKRLLSAGEAAALLGCSRWTVNRLVRLGQLKAIRWGRSRRFRLHDLEQFVRLKVERVR